MRLDIKEVERFVSVLALTAEKLELYRDEIAGQRVRLQTNSELREVVYELLLTEKKISEQSEKIKKIQNAVKKICDVVTQCESDICDNIESVGSIYKQSFSCVSQINSDLHSVWRIE